VERCAWLYTQGPSLVNRKRRASTSIVVNSVNNDETVGQSRRPEPSL
jgi:hypothetical protein